MSENLIKQTCKELGLTYKQLGELIGFNGDTLNNMASKSNDKLSLQLLRAIELYKETIELKKELTQLENLKTILKELIKWYSLLAYNYKLYFILKKDNLKLSIHLTLII